MDPSTESSELEEFLTGGFDGGDVSGGAKRKKGRKRGGATLPSWFGIETMIIVVTFLIILGLGIALYHKNQSLSAALAKSSAFEGYAGGSGINIGGSCCKTYHTPSMTEIEYPASDGCGTCNSGCNLRYDTSSSSEGFAVSDLASYDNASSQMNGCGGPSVRVSGCASNQLGPYEMSENVLAQSLFTN